MKEDVEMSKPKKHVNKGTWDPKFKYLKKIQRAVLM